MNSVLYRLRCELGARRTAGVLVVVALVGTVVLILVGGAVRTLSAADRYSDEQGDEFDLAVEQSSGPPLTEELEALASTAQVELASFAFAGVVAEGAEAPAEALVFAGSPLALGSRVTDGRLPDPTEPGEFVASSLFLEKTGAAVGDRFRLLTITQQQADELGFDVPEPAGPTASATLVGVTEGLSDQQEPTAIAVFPASMLGLGDVGVSASVGLVALADGATTDDLRAEIDGLPGAPEIGIEQAEWVPEDIRSAASTQGQGLAVVAAIAALAALAVVGQLLSREVRVPGPERRVLGALGTTRVQVLAESLGRALVPAVAGAVVASVLAYIASGLFPMGFARPLEPDPGRLFLPAVHVLGAGALAVGLAVWLAVSLAVHERRPVPPGRPGLVERTVGRARPVAAATGVRFALTRPPSEATSPRTAILGVVAVLAVLVGALTFGLNLDRLVDDPDRWGTNFDVGVGSGGEELGDEIVARLEAEPDVAGLTLYGTVLASVGGTPLDVTGMRPIRGDLRPEVLRGALPDDAREIVLGRVAARDAGVGVGDDVTITSGAANRSFRVTGLAVIPGIEGGDGIGEGAVVTADGLRRLEPTATLATAAIDLRTGAPADTAERLSAETGRGIGPLDRPVRILNLERIRSTPYVVAGTLGALGVLSLAHLLLLSAQRRRRELAVLRALGATRRWTGAVVHWQATAFLLLVVALAAPLGVALGRLVTAAFVDRLGASDDIGVPLLSVGVVGLGLVVLGNLAATLPARRARRAVLGRALSPE